MDLPLFNQAQPILVIAVAAGLVIGLIVFALASRNRARAAAATASSYRQSTRDNPATVQSPPDRAPAPKRSLSRDTRQRATNLINEIARVQNDQTTG